LSCPPCTPAEQSVGDPAEPTAAARERIAALEREAAESRAAAQRAQETAEWKQSLDGQHAAPRARNAELPRGIGRLRRGILLGTAVIGGGVLAWVAAQQEETSLPDPALSVQPGSGLSFRDRLVNGQQCPTCPEMVVAPNGKFTMGSPKSEPERDSDEEQVSVLIAKPFAVGKFAVMRGEFAAFVEETGHKTDDGCWVWSGSKWEFQANKSWRAPGFAQDDRHPVLCVNWNDAKAYAEWLSSKTGKTYRLLSEAEREYATRAGSTAPFWWGTPITPRQANYNGNLSYAGGGSKGEYRQQTVPVDSFEPNPWGLYNVHGNVWEWIEDCWNESDSGNPGNGSARKTGDCGHRVVRGGSWVDNPGLLRSAFRSGVTTDGRSSYLGFRIGRTLTP
jgi:formylglycine-generating enzyme required for sulfatase activity